MPWVPERGQEDFSLTQEGSFHLVDAQARVDGQIDRDKFKNLLSAAGLG